MKAIILAAGKGSRLQPYTNERPKCLVEIGGRSLLDRQISILRSRGIDDVVIVGGHKSFLLRSRATRLYVNQRFDETNMVWSLLCAAEELIGDVIVSYGDIVYSTSLLDDVVASTADIGVAVDLDWESYWSVRFDDPLSDAETLTFGQDGCILELGQKASSLGQIEGQYMGLTKFSSAGLEIVRSILDTAGSSSLMRGRSVHTAQMTDLIQAVIDLGHKVIPVPTNGGWVEVDTVHDLQSPITRERLSAIDAGVSRA